MDKFIFTSYQQKDNKSLNSLIKSVGWNERQIKGQLDAIHQLVRDSNGRVIIAKENNKLIGYICAKFNEWNRLGKIHGLIVHSKKRRKKIGSHLVEAIEKFMEDKKARGIYVDTPLNNKRGREFYETLGYNQDYKMTGYYDKGIDGVTYVKFFGTQKINFY